MAQFLGLLARQECLEHIFPKPVNYMLERRIASGRKEGIESGETSAHLLRLFAEWLKYLKIPASRAAMLTQQVQALGLSPSSRGYGHFQLNRAHVPGPWVSSLDSGFELGVTP